MPKASTSKLDKSKTSKADLGSRSDQNVKIMKASSTEGPAKQLSPRLRRNMERVEMLARPPARRLRSLWDEKCAFLPPERRDKIKSALEEEYFLSPEQTEQYFQAMNESKPWTGQSAMTSRKEHVDKTRELRQRQKWLVNFSAQVAYRLCDYIAKGQKEMLVSNRLRSIADVVLERVAEILGEPKPSRTDPGRLPRFMVAVSDRIAVWIENAVYRADAIEPAESGTFHEHMRLDAEKPLLYQHSCTTEGLRAVLVISIPNYPQNLQDEIRHDPPPLLLGSGRRRSSAHHHLARARCSCSRSQDHRCWPHCCQRCGCSIGRPWIYWRLHLNSFICYPAFGLSALCNWLL